MRRFFLVALLTSLIACAVSAKTIIGYDSNNGYKPVVVEAGKYYPGISFERPLGASCTIPQQGGTGICSFNAGNNGLFLSQISPGVYGFQAATGTGITQAYASSTFLTIVSSTALNYLGLDYPALASSTFLSQTNAASTYLPISYPGLATSSFLGQGYTALATSTFLPISASTSLAYLNLSYPSLATSTFLNQNYTALATSTFLQISASTSLGYLGYGYPALATSTFLNQSYTALATSTFLSQTNAASTYLPIGYPALATSTFLSQANAATTYLPITYPSLATSTFLSQSSAAITYLPISYPSLATSTFLNASIFNAYPALATSTFLSLSGGTLTGGVTFTNATSTNFFSMNGNFTNVTTTNLKVTNCVGCGSANPAGNNGDLQFNDNGAFGGSSTLRWDKINKVLHVGVSTTLLTPTTLVQYADEDGLKSDWSFRVATGGYPIIGFGKSRGTLDYPSSTLGNDPLGSVYFYDYTNAFNENAGIEVRKIDSATSTSGSEMFFSTTPEGTTNNRTDVLYLTNLMSVFYSSTTMRSDLIVNGNSTLATTTISSSTITWANLTNSIFGNATSTRLYINSGGLTVSGNSTLATTTITSSTLTQANITTGIFSNTSIISSLIIPTSASCNVSGVAGKICLSTSGQLQANPTGSATTTYPNYKVKEFYFATSTDPTLSSTATSTAVPLSFWENSTIVGVMAFTTSTGFSTGTLALYLADGTLISTYTATSSVIAPQVAISSNNTVSAGGSIYAYAGNATGTLGLLKVTVKYTEDPK